MGFIDYHGSRPDRYSEVLELAKARQDEEAKQKTEAEVLTWLGQKLKFTKVQYPCSVNTVLRCVMDQYNVIHALYEEILHGQIASGGDGACIWNDFCTAFISAYLETFMLNEDRKRQYYQTFMTKVFKLCAFTDADTHYDSLICDQRYKEYYRASFGIAGEKQFWKWLRNAAGGHSELYVKFIDEYRLCAALLGYFLFCQLDTADDRWLKYVKLEWQSLEAERDGSERRSRYRKPDTKKLINPLRKVSAVEPEDGSKPSETVKTAGAGLDKAAFEEILESRSLLRYIEGCRMLRSCSLSSDMDEAYEKIMRRLQVLIETVNKYENIYQAELYEFYEYYIPEAFRLSAGYLEYRDAEIGEDILNETKTEVLAALNKLLLAVNAEIDEIYRFASIEIRASARALDAVMSQNGYADREYRLDEGRDDK